MSHQSGGSETAFLGVGSNLGDRDGTIARAIERLRQIPGIEVEAVSTLIDSTAEGGGDRPAYRNGAIRLRTTLTPAALLAVCKELERAAGRRLPAPRHADRPLDLDLLLFGEHHIDTRELVVPHPRLHDRDFVLRPLRELGVDPAQLPRPERPERIASADGFAARCTGWLHGGCTIGLVPTMGALHAGHRSLIATAARECDRTVVTIFVNPLQFGPGEDFAAYPRDPAGDLRQCAEAGADLVFAPGVEQMYPPGFCSEVQVGAAADGMEGALRPGHFRGVATVVARLFALARPQRAYFGKKDAQQVAVLRRLVADLGFPLRLIECPIVREPDGLAMSSRNVYLGAADRRAATVLHRALQAARAARAAGERDAGRLLHIARDVIAAEPRAALDYLELRQEGELQPLPPGPVGPCRMLVAARFRDGVRPVRLLDNLSLDPGQEP